MLKKMALVAGSLAVLVSATGCCGLNLCGINCCWAGVLVNGLDLVRDLFDYTIVI